MNSMQKIRDGLDILLRYEPDGEACAQHDVIYACGVEPDDIGREDRDKLEKLRWMWDHSNDSWYTFT